MDGEKQWYHHCDRNWIEIMKYIRTVSGRVYEDQILDLLKKWPLPVPEPCPGGLIGFLNDFPTRCPGFDPAWDHEFLKSDPRTGGIYTVPGVRALLDPAIASIDAGYLYNPFLYTDSWQQGLAQLQAAGAAVQRLDITAVPALCERGVIQLENGLLHIDFSTLTDGCTRYVLFRDFDLQQLARAAQQHLGGAATGIGRLDLRYLLFEGDARFALTELALVLEHGAGLDGITCAGSFDMDNLVFRFDGSGDPEGGYDWSQLAFRNARFFGDVRLRDIRLTGVTAGAAVSFEDARIAGSLGFENMEFGCAALFCFQTVLGDFLRSPFDGHGTEYIAGLQMDTDTHRLRLRNASFDSSAQIDFADMEMLTGQITLENISALPGANLRLACWSTPPGPGAVRVCPRVYLLLRNCGITDTLIIGNVEQLSFLESHNYGYIEADGDWQRSPHWGSQRTAGPGGTPIINKLLLAVYKATPQLQPFAQAANATGRLALAKARDFIMLKSNFAACGMYEDEDVAWILHMEFKPALNAVVVHGKPEQEAKPGLLTTLLYRFLYATGKYGISPVRVLVSMLLVVALWTVVYMVLLSVQGPGAFSIGGTAMGALASGSFLGRLWAALLYSVAGVIPFVSQFEPISVAASVLTVAENAFGIFLTGYFSVAVVRKTLH